MSLAYASELLTKARTAGYAVGAFNMYNLETLQAIISAAEELRAPVLVQVNAGTAEFMGQQTVANLVRTTCGCCYCACGAAPRPWQELR